MRVWDRSLRGRVPVCVPDAPITAGPVLGVSLPRHGVASVSSHTQSGRGSPPAPNVSGPARTAQQDARWIAQLGEMSAIKPRWLGHRHRTGGRRATYEYAAVALTEHHSVLVGDVVLLASGPDEPPLIGIVTSLGVGETGGWITTRWFFRARDCGQPPVAAAAAAAGAPADDGTVRTHVFLSSVVRAPHPARRAMTLNAILRLCAASRGRAQGSRAWRCAA